MIRGRIAPTPSGYLHIGNAVNFVITWLWTRKENGILRLRIDDRITAVVLQEHMDDIFQAMHWLGLDWDEGPQTPDEQQKIYSQHLHIDNYAALLDRVVQTGKVYACTCSRKIIHAQSAGQPFNCECRSKGISLNQPDVTWRIMTSEEVDVIVPDVKAGPVPVNLFQHLHDFTVRRKDGQPTYHIASLSDDIEHQTNLIVRGMDLMPSTAAQLFLSEMIGGTNFNDAKFYHHPLLMGDGGEKLSKSAGSKKLRIEWDQVSPEKFYIWLSGLFGWQYPATSAQQMLQYAKQGQPAFFQRQ